MEKAKTKNLIRTCKQLKKTVVLQLHKHEINEENLTERTPGLWRITILLTLEFHRRKEQLIQK